MAEDSGKEMLRLSTQLKHYKRRDIQDEMAEHARDREVAFRFGAGGFGSRPDMLVYPADVLAAAKRGASSFHASEERWSDPLALSPGMRPKELEDLRIGWDLVLDVDCPHWEHARIVTDLLIRALELKGVKSISCKFSGNKGFHIGVPFETFPAEVHGRPIEAAFPEGVHRIARYLAYLIDSKEMGFALSKEMLCLGEDALAQQLSLPKEKLFASLCETCGQPKPEASLQQKEFVCRNTLCKAFGRTAPPNEAHKVKALCPDCSKLRDEVILPQQKKSGTCRHCGSSSFRERFNSALVLNLDTQLISARHLYRMPWSLHEKSGLASLPITPKRARTFERQEASPERVRVEPGLRFLDRERCAEGESTALLIAAWDHWDAVGGTAGKMLASSQEGAPAEREVEIPEEAIPESAFPPCVLLALKGLKDGRKRFLFCLVNFLHSLGWSYEQIEGKLKEWNALNPEPLSETLIVGQVRYHKQQAKRALPPNCANQHYYAEISICKPDELCQRIRNPVSYAKRKARFSEAAAQAKAPKGRKGKKTQRMEKED